MSLLFLEKVVHLLFVSYGENREKSLNIKMDAREKLMFLSLKRTLSEHSIIHFINQLVVRHN